MSRLLLVMLPALALAAAPVGPVPQMPEIHLAMDDQFEHHHDAGRYRGDVAVILYGDHGGSDANHHLGRELFEQFHPSARGLPPEKSRFALVSPVAGFPPGTRSPEVHIVHVDCAGKQNAVLRAFERRKLRLSADEPIWIDFGTK